MAWQNPQLAALPREKKSGDYVVQDVEVFTDGACRGNPGPGGWGALLRYGDTEKELFGGEQDTTNNRMATA